MALDFFDDPARWNDHATLGRSIGLLPWAMWIPAVVGRTSPGVIGATVLLLILLEAQYAFITVDTTVANALHPLNGSIMLVLSCGITQRVIASLRQTTDRLRTRASTHERARWRKAGIPTRWEERRPDCARERVDSHGNPITVTGDTPWHTLVRRSPIRARDNA